MISIVITLVILSFDYTSYYHSNTYAHRLQSIDRELELVVLDLSNRVNVAAYELEVRRGAARLQEMSNSDTWLDDAPDTRTLT